MESPRGKKRPRENDKESHSDSEKSVQSYIYLGDVNNTVNECSSSESSCEKSEVKKKKKAKLFLNDTQNRQKSDSDENSDDCKITGYETPPKENDLNTTKVVQSIYPNQMQDPNVAKLYFQDDLYDADDDDDDDTDGNSTTKI